jgi:hypothetical protein
VPSAHGKTNPTGVGSTHPGVPDGGVQAALVWTWQGPLSSSVGAARGSRRQAQTHAPYGVRNNGIYATFLRIGRKYAQTGVMGPLILASVGRLRSQTRLFKV